MVLNKECIRDILIYIEKHLTQLKEPPLGSF